jgi:hypothetical protein
LALKPDGPGLTVVGDDAQSIYSFRAATVRNILDFPAQFSRAAEIITLERNCDLPRESWTTVQVRLNPAHDASGRVDIWLNGTFCGTYQGPMADSDYGARRNGAPFINAQPRFGIYRDWRAETQTIYFDKIIFWNAEPSGNPDWR